MPDKSWNDCSQAEKDRWWGIAPAASEPVSAATYQAALELACADVSGTPVEAARLRDGYIRAALASARGETNG